MHFLDKLRKQFTVIGFYLSVIVFVLTLTFAYYGYNEASEEQRKGLLGLFLFSCLFLFINWVNFRKF